MEFNSIVEIWHYFNTSANGDSLRFLSTQLALYNLQSTDLVCDYFSIGLHPLFIAEVQSVVEEVQNLIRQAAGRRRLGFFVIDPTELSSTHQAFIDPTELTLSNLRSASTSLDIRNAWRLLTRRLFLANEYLQLLCTVEQRNFASTWARFKQRTAQKQSESRRAAERVEEKQKRMVERVYRERQALQRTLAACSHFMALKVKTNAPIPFPKPLPPSRKTQAVRHKSWRCSVLRSASNRALAVYFHFVPVTFAARPQESLCQGKHNSDPTSISSSGVDTTPSAPTLQAPSCVPAVSSPQHPQADAQHKATPVRIEIPYEVAREMEAQYKAHPRCGFVEGIGLVWGAATT
ncbi:hypothetical protein C8R46DRAFT_1233001 [Mycena filopes]|nr:hypothetical protein C8R46DRAFT_1233001 [Mycena filopes]